MRLILAQVEACTQRMYLVTLSSTCATKTLIRWWIHPSTSTADTLTQSCRLLGSSSTGHLCELHYIEWLASSAGPAQVVSMPPCPQWGSMSAHYKRGLETYTKAANLKTRLSRPTQRTSVGSIVANQPLGGTQSEKNSDQQRVPNEYQCANAQQ